MTFNIYKDITIIYRDKKFEFRILDLGNFIKDKGYCNCNLYSYIYIYMNINNMLSILLYLIHK